MNPASVKSISKKLLSIRQDDMKDLPKVSFKTSHPDKRERLFFASQRVILDLKRSFDQNKETFLNSWDL